MIFRLSAGNKHDAPEGRKLIESFYSEDKHYLLMDRAYEDNETRELAVKQGFVPVVPPKRNRKNPWEYDKELYKRRNEVERYFLRIKRFRRVFTRYDKLDVLYLGNLTLAMIFDAILMRTGSKLFILKFTKLYRNNAYLYIPFYSAFILVFKLVFSLETLCKLKDIHGFVFVYDITVFLCSYNKLFSVLYEIFV